MPQLSTGFLGDALKVSEKCSTPGRGCAVLSTQGGLGRPAAEWLDTDGELGQLYIMQCMERF